MDITQLLAFTVKNKASDLHLSAGHAPMIRVDGELRQVDTPALLDDEVRNLLRGTMSETQWKEFEQNQEIDFSFELNNVARFRVNVFLQNRGIAGVFRVIPEKILSLEELNFPAVFKQICDYPNGLVLVTGPTGSGKSTTLAAMIDYINTTRREHILTIEDPIEFVHTSKKSLLNQREVRAHTQSFENALRSGLREDPDVILVGEMRDLETIRLALTAAETGHLVFATLHTISAAKTTHRIIDVFPGKEKEMIRAMLADTLRTVIAQVLLRSVSGGRVAAFEIMMSNPAIRNLIRENKIAQMYSVMQTGSREGMKTLDQHLVQLIAKNIITKEVAYKVAIDKKEFS